MFRPVALFLVGMIAIFVDLSQSQPHLTQQQPQQYSSSVIEQSNFVSPPPSSLPASKSYNTQPQASYVAIPSAAQPSVTPSPSPIPKFYNSFQQTPFVGFASGPQQPQYVVVPSNQQPNQYVSVSPQQPIAYSAAPPVAQQQQPLAYSAFPSAPQPTSFVAASPKFYSAPVSAAQPVLSDGSSAKFVSAPVAAAQPILTDTASPKFLSSSVVASPSVVPASPIPIATKVAPQVQVKSGIADKDAQIVNEGREVGYDGSFNYGFDTENGISVKSKGYTKPAASPNDEPIQVIEGSYQFVDAYGKLQTIHYIADELGYRAYGDGIPQPHEEILKSLAHRR